MRRVLACALLSTFACGGPAVTSAPVEAGSAVAQRGDAPMPAPPCNLEASFPYVTPEEQQARIAAYSAQNTGHWHIVPENDMDGVFGYIRRATRLDSIKGSNPGADPELVGRTFFERNAAFLGFTAQDFKRAKYTLHDNSHTLALDGPIAGFESYAVPPFRILNVTYSVIDGDVGGFHSMSSIMPLVLDLCSRAPAPAKLQNVIGRELFYIPHVYVQTSPPTPMGKVDLASITKREPVVFEQNDDRAKRFIVGWRVTVERENQAWAFTVAASDGRLLAAAD